MSFSPFEIEKDKIKFQNLREKIIKNFEISKNYEINKKINIDYNFGAIQVVAKNKIKKGEMIESSPIFSLVHRSIYHLDPSIRKKAFAFNKNCDCSECKRHGFSLIIVGGYGCFYDTSNLINAANSIWSVALNYSLWFNIALKDIEAGERIVILKDPNYKEYIKQDINSENIDWSRIPLTPTNL
jgi:hypothetical protein